MYPSISPGFASIIDMHLELPSSTNATAVAVAKMTRESD